MAGHVILTSNEMQIYESTRQEICHMNIQRDILKNCICSKQNIKKLENTQSLNLEWIMCEKLV